MIPTVRFATNSTYSSHVGSHMLAVHTAGRSNLTGRFAADLRPDRRSPCGRMPRNPAPCTPPAAAPRRASRSTPRTCPRWSLLPLHTPMPSRCGRERVARGAQGVAVVVGLAVGGCQGVLGWQRWLSAMASSDHGSKALGGDLREERSLHPAPRKRQIQFPLYMAERQKDRKTERQKDRKTERQKETQRIPTDAPSITRILDQGAEPPSSSAGKGVCHSSSAGRTPSVVAHASARSVPTPYWWPARPRPPRPTPLA
eukprot:SAG31_NODE_11261_length_1048_cov_2.298209_1_plen_256_part_00